MPILKRKRSESELSFCSQLSSPPRPNDTSFSFPTAAGVNLFPSSRSPTPSHLSGRTMKRFRDSRPSEEEIHHNTLELLRSGQRQQAVQQQQQSLSQHSVPSPRPAAAAAATRQTSLHSFWKLPGKQAQASSATTLPLSQDPSPSACIPTATSCEDCGGDLLGEDSMMMDTDGGECGAEGCACSACGKAVCFSCSVGNLGAHRECLACAGRNVVTSRGGWATGLIFG